jgi:hypothetical protein
VDEQEWLIRKGTNETRCYCCLECGVMWSGRSLSMPRKKFLPPSSGLIPGIFMAARSIQSALLNGLESNYRLNILPRVRGSHNEKNGF